MDLSQLNVASEIAKDAYSDGGKPFVKPTGELIGLIPRTIKAACLPLEKWILAREYNLAETQKLLELKLQKVSPELIETPDPYIAVPAFQYISYCMDNEELRNMYANLLANSMNKMVKEGVHPSFIEIIKQLCPDEAMLLREIYNFGEEIAVVSIYYINENYSRILAYRNFSTIGLIANCRQPYEIQKYFDNLFRLGLIETEQSAKASDAKQYEPIEAHPFIKHLLDIPERYIELGHKKTEIIEGYFDLTAFGKSFCRICIEKNKADNI